jgi:phosphohistidine phosphatase SixA
VCLFVRAVPTLAKRSLTASHDVAHGVADLVDPKLTPKGCAEAQAVSDWSAANLYDAEAVFVSPM